jgi:hypothetical protein
MNHNELTFKNLVLKRKTGLNISHCYINDDLKIKVIYDYIASEYKILFNSVIIETSSNFKDCINSFILKIKQKKSELEKSDLELSKQIKEYESFLNIMNNDSKINNELVSKLLHKEANELAIKRFNLDSTIVIIDNILKLTN